MVSLTRNSAPVEEEQEFTVCLSSYRASGAGGYPWYAGCPVEREIDVEMTELILRFFDKYPRGVGFEEVNFRVLGDLEIG